MPSWERSPFNVQVTTNCSTVPLCMPVQITPYSRWHGRHFPYFGPICTAFQDMGKSWDQWKPVIWHEGPIKHFEKALFTILMTYRHETRIFTKNEKQEKFENLCVSGMWRFKINFSVCYHPGRPMYKPACSLVLSPIIDFCVFERTS